MFFQKNLEDIVKLTKSLQGDSQSFLSALVSDIKTELNSQDPKTKSNAVLKLYFLKMEGFDVRFANFQLIEMMSSQKFQMKRLAYTTANTNLDSSSEFIYLTTNTYRKDLSSTNFVECSTVLSSLANICTNEIATKVVTNVMTLLSHNKPIVRKKAYTALSCVFRVAPELVKDNLEKAMERIPNKEDNNSVLVASLSMMNTVFNLDPRLNPLFLKPLTEILSKTKNNWLTIKIIKLLDKIMNVQPRLVSKLVEPYFKLLKSTTAKSIEYELIFTIIKHFPAHKEIYNLACENLKGFINHADANLRNLGLQCLKHMLKNNENQIKEYVDYLIDSFKKADGFTKLLILEIFKNFTSDDILDEVVGEFLTVLETNLEEQMQNIVIDTIIFFCGKDHFAHITDHEWLLFDVFLKLSRKITYQSTATLYTQTISELLIRVEDLKPSVYKFCTNALSGFENFSEKQNRDQSEGIDLFGGSQEKVNTARELIFQSLLLFLGESLSEVSLPSEFIYVLRFLDNGPLLRMYSNSRSHIQILIFKVVIYLSDLLIKGNEKATSNLQKIKLSGENETNNNNNNNTREDTFAKLYYFIHSINKKLLAYDGDRNPRKQLFDFYTNLFYSVIGLNTDYVMNEDEINAEVFNLENMKKISDLRILIDKGFPPIHPDAQSFVKPPEGLDLNTEIPINQAEGEMISSMMKDMSLNEEKEVKKKKKTSKKDEKDKNNEKVDTLASKEEGGNNLEEEKTVEKNESELPLENTDNQNTREVKKEKKTFKVNKDQLLPPGIVLKAEETENIATSEQPKKTKKKKEKKQEDGNQEADQNI